MKNKKLTAVALVASLAAVMFGGCEQHILDGPGMINPASWDSFTVSRNDSIAQYNFCITVEQRNEGLFVLGEFRGEDGSEFVEEDGMLIPAKEAGLIYELEPALLPDVQQDTTETWDEELFPDGMMVLDESSVEIEVVCTDGRILEKIDEDNFSIKVYQIVSSCF